jgi:alcohol dehydrogenase YqhD (iron-dependent ADH family)
MDEIGNDLYKNFRSNGVLTSSDLSERYHSFMAEQNNKYKVFLNFYCPFWINDGKNHDMEITLNMTQKHTAESERELVDQSIQKFNNFFSVVGAISSLNDIVSSKYRDEDDDLKIHDKWFKKITTEVFEVTLN